MKGREPGVQGFTIAISPSVVAITSEFAFLNGHPSPTKRVQRRGSPLDETIAYLPVSVDPWRGQRQLLTFRCKRFTVKVG